MKPIHDTIKASRLFFAIEGSGHQLIVLPPHIAGGKIHIPFLVEKCLSGIKLIKLKRAEQTDFFQLPTTKEHFPPVRRNKNWNKHKT